MKEPTKRPKPKRRPLTIERLTAGVQTIDANVGVALIASDFKVRWANGIHLKAWPGLVGQTCYEYLNGFQKPCKWCPVKKTLADGKLHIEHVCSPYKGQLRYSDIVAVPLFQTKGDEQLVAEVVLETTAKTHQENESRIAMFDNIGRFGRILESLKSSQYVPGFLLLGLIWDQCLNIPYGELYTLATNVEHGKMCVLDASTLTTSLPLQDRMRDLHGSTTQAELTRRSGDLEANFLQSIDISNDRPHSFRDMFMQKHPTVDQEKVHHLETRRGAIRLNASTAAIRIPTGRDDCYVVVAQIRNTGHDLLLSDQMVELSLYGSLAERALRNRVLVATVNKAIDKNEKLLLQLERDSASLAFASSIVSSFAHDLRASCAAILGNLSAIWQTVPPARQTDLKERHETTMKECTFIGECMQRAIDIARLRAIDRSTFTLVNLPDLVRDCVKALDRIIERNKITTAIVIDKDSAECWCDRIFMKQVISNLIGNACYALENVKHRVRNITIRCAQSGGKTTIIVEDNGCGIDPGLREVIWRPFFSTKGRGIGTGMGLHICRRIVEEVHRGTIRVESRYGYGAKFIVQLPQKAVEGQAQT